VITLKSGDIVIGNRDAAGYGYTSTGTQWVYVHHHHRDTSQIGILGMAYICSDRVRHHQACIALQKYIAKNYHEWEEIKNKGFLRSNAIDYMRKFFPDSLDGAHSSYDLLSFFYVREEAFDVHSPLILTNKDGSRLLTKLGDDIDF